jgi:hypothetical protein
MRGTFTPIRRASVAVAVAAFAAVVPVAASAGPGHDFPEQPGTNLTQACQVILSNPDRALNFLTGEQHMSNQAAAILIAQYLDACLGG